MTQEYKILTSNSPKELEVAVNSLLHQEWRLVGGVQSTSIIQYNGVGQLHLSQTLIKSDSLVY